MYVTIQRYCLSRQLLSHMHLISSNNMNKRQQKVLSFQLLFLRMF